MLTAGVASATSTVHYYGELLTSNEVPLVPGDIRARVDLAFEVDPLDTVALGSVDYGAGLGAGYLASGAIKNYTHVFAPAADVSSILSSTLVVGVFDDAFGDGPETVSISLDDEFWKSGQATLNLLAGSIKASVYETDGQFNVRVRARGDTMLAFSYFSAKYISDSVSGDSASPAPEPGGVALFYTGLVVVGAARSQMRSWRRR
jgi:hypothetical protein